MTIAAKTRAEIEMMISRFDAAQAAGKTLSDDVLPMYQAAKAVLGCGDESWFAAVRRSVALPDEAKTLVIVAAKGHHAANIKPLI